jgi:large subunit ribosomal protein L21
MEERRVYAIVKTGGKQYRVEEGQILRVERLTGEKGLAVTLGEVLLLGGDGETRVGSPLVAGASVVGTVVETGRGPKVRVFRYKKRKHQRKTRGHRQDFTALRIDKIQF